MPPIMDLDHLMFADHWEMCQGCVGGECRVVGEGQGVGTVDSVLLDCAKNCTKETRQCAGGAQILYIWPQLHTQSLEIRDFV